MRPWAISTTWLEVIQTQWQLQLLLRRLLLPKQGCLVLLMLLSDLL
jgi:hypothetical protein